MPVVLPRMRRASVLVAMAMLTVTVMPNALAQGSDATTVHFTARYTDPAGAQVIPGGIDPMCPPGQVALHDTAYFQKPLRTVDTATGCVSYDPSAQVAAAQSNEAPAIVLAGYTDDHHVGWLDGCGKGSFVMHQTNIKIVSADPAAQTWRGTFEWTVKDGTGAFRGASGHGTGYGDFTWSPNLTTVPPGFPNFGTYQGYITCPHHDG